MNKPNIRVYKCSNAGKFECCGACRFTDSHTTTIGCECDLYVGEEMETEEICRGCNQPISKCTKQFRLCRGE